jgi:hypothetical protein
MKKHNYRTKKVNEINWPELGQQLGGEAVTFAVDVWLKRSNMPC